MASSAIGSQSLTVLSLPSGVLFDFGGTVEPAGWLMCDGRAVSRTVYSALFSAIGISYGSGDGSTTFNLPDFRGRFARYNDNMGTAAGAASRDTGRVHGSGQSQATAKNGLANSSSSISGNSNTTGQVVFPVLNYSFDGLTGISGIAAGRAGSGSAGNYVTANNHSHSVTGTASAQTITGDTETRPINLSCNKIIKI